MAANTVNLNKLKDEIDQRKRQKNIIPSNLGESVGTGATPKDTFLHGLLMSRNTGVETPSTKLIKLVENKVAVKHGEVAKHVVNETILPPVSHKTPPPQRLSEIDVSPERDEQLFADLDKKRRQTLAESMQGYISGTQVQSQTQVQPQTNLNETYLVENVKKIVNNYLIENFGPVVEEAIKSTILEMYAVERIKEVLHENKELIKSVVIEVIREIQSKNKAKAQT